MRGRRAGGLRAVTVVAAEEKADKRRRPLRLALASYTLRNFKLDQTLAMTQRVGLDAICLKSMPPAARCDARADPGRGGEGRKAGLELYGGGVIHDGK